MGVPGFFAWLLKKYKRRKIITTEINKKVDVLYLDSNCLFHPQCYTVLNYYLNKKKKIDINKLEEKMIDRIISYITYLIGVVVPEKEVYIAVDGVAPMAKMNQQRKRRYKAVQDNELRDEIKRKYQKPVGNVWSNAAITPGTIFMEKLHSRLLEYIKNNPIGLKIKYTYSSYHTPGEGEHKILQDIKSKGINNDNVYVIYGLDADLIFLSLASNKNNIYLLREDTFINNKPENKEIIDIIKDVGEELNFVSVDETRNSINYQISDIISKINNINTDELRFNFCNDFIVICYFLGNDFLPNIPSIEIKNEGLDILLKVYIDTFLTLNNIYMVMVENDNYEINNIFLFHFIDGLSKYEDYYFKIKLPKYFEMINKRSPLTDDPYEIEIWKMENMKNYNVIDPIKLGYDRPELWKYRYYEHYYNSKGEQRNFIDKMCKEYINGLKFVLKYYFESCISWNWYYPYHNAPFISDIHYFLRQSNYNIEKDVLYMKSDPLPPMIQLLTVIPPKCYELLPNKYRYFMISDESEIIDLFPVRVQDDMINKESLHKCVPFIPNVDIKRVLNAVSNISLSNEEQKRNIYYDELIINN